MVERALIKGPAAALLAFARGPPLVAPSPGRQFLDHRDQSLLLAINLIDAAHLLGFGFVDDQLRAGW